MIRIVLGLVLVLVFLLVMFGCKPETTPFEISCSIMMDGEQLIQNDNRMMISSYGKAFYMSDYLIFHLGDSLIKRSLNSISGYQLTPVHLVITDKKYMGIDYQRLILYFAANHAIYKVGFGGENLTRLSLDDGRQYSAPALSNCGNYLTSIVNNRINKLDLQTGQWTELTSPVTATYAVYTSDTDEYFFFSKSTTDYPYTYTLSKLTGTTQDSISIMTMNGSGYYDSRTEFSVSNNHRFIAMHHAKKPERDYSYISVAWIRYRFPLWVYDRQTGIVINIPDCYSYAFSPISDEIIYSRYKFGMADIMRMDLDSGQEEMVWDGYYNKNHFSYCIEHFFIRGDGNLMFFEGWKRALRPPNDSKSPVGSMMLPEVTGSD